jgi:hypothetical protein
MKDCDAMQIGPIKFYCGRKHKFGFSLQGICDSRGFVQEVFIKHLALASDYVAFMMDSFLSAIIQLQKDLSCLVILPMLVISLWPLRIRVFWAQVLRMPTISFTHS